MMRPVPPVPTSKRGVVLVLLAEVRAPPVLCEGGREVEVVGGDDDAVRAPDRVLLRHRAVLERSAVVVGRADELVLDAAGVLEVESPLAEAFDLGDVEAVLGQAVAPVRQRGLGDRQHQDLRLVGALAPDPARLAHREAGDERRLVAHVVAVVEVQDRSVAVVQRGLLHTLQAEDLRVEVVVLLSSTHAERDVVVALDGRARIKRGGHASALLLVLVLVVVVDSVAAAACKSRLTRGGGRTGVPRCRRNDRPSSLVASPGCVARRRSAARARVHPFGGTILVTAAIGRVKTPSLQLGTPMRKIGRAGLSRCADVEFPQFVCRTLIRPMYQRCGLGRACQGKVQLSPEHPWRARCGRRRRFALGAARAIARARSHRPASGGAVAAPAAGTDTGARCSVDTEAGCLDNAWGGRKTEVVAQLFVLRTTRGE